MNKITTNTSEEYLFFVLSKLQKRIQELDQKIADGQKDIDRMHDYYWESYTEMDEYGYENYDNQQALFQQMNSTREQQIFRRRLRKMLDSPYFGRVDFQYDGEDDAEVFYIGIASFSEGSGQIPLIYDWRAPVSSLFYDYDKGPASYLAPGGRMSGEVVSKWQYKIRNSKLIYAFESDIKIDDDILKAELGMNGDIHLKNIIRTIQKEQNEIIRNTKDRIMIIQGAAGSGKTSIALHRIAYLLYHDRKYLKSSNILILSPNTVFSDYISQILPELGEEPIQEMSFDLFAYRELLPYINDCEDQYDLLEQQLFEPEAGSKFHEKQSADFIGMMEGYLAILEDSLVQFHKIHWKGYEKSEYELIHLFYDKFTQIPLLSRMDSVMEYVIDEYETLRGRDLTEEERTVITEEFQKMYETKDLYVIYSQFLEMFGFEPLPDLPQKERFLRYEDVFPMLYMKYRLCSVRQHKHIKHLVVDEMQDYSYLQYCILETMFSCRMTILGDKAQTMDEEQQDVLQFLPKIYGRQIRKIVLNKSYRNTVEITEYANRLIGLTGINVFQRHGVPIKETIFNSKEAALQSCLKYLYPDSKGVLVNGYETAAILTKTEREALWIYEHLKEYAAVTYLDRNSSSFQKGLTVTTFYLAKGLEFDCVCSWQQEIPNQKLARQAEYICATRALHELSILHIEN